jgi:hypothetical protein
MAFGKGILLDCRAVIHPPRARRKSNSQRNPHRHPDGSRQPSGLRNVPHRMEAALPQGKDWPPPRQRALLRNGASRAVLTRTLTVALAGRTDQ